MHAINDIHNVITKIMIFTCQRHRAGHCMASCGFALLSTTQEVNLLVINKRLTWMKYKR